MEEKIKSKGIQRITIEEIAGRMIDELAYPLSDKSEILDCLKFGDIMPILGRGGRLIFTVPGRFYFTFSEKGHVVDYKKEQEIFQLLKPLIEDGIITAYDLDLTTAYDLDFG